MFKSLRVRLAWIIYKATAPLAEAHYRSRAFDFARGLDQLAQNGERFAKENKPFSDVPLPPSQRYTRGVTCTVPFGNDFALKIESRDTGIVYQLKLEPVLDVRVYVKRHDQDEWLMIFHQDGQNTKRFNYSLGWVRHLWIMIEAERDRLEKLKDQDIRERFRSLDEQNE